MVCVKDIRLEKKGEVEFPGSKTRSKGGLDLVHSKIYDLMSVESILGCIQFVKFIYEHSRRTHIYFLKAKNDIYWHLIFDIRKIM